jgi:hypothetical protein
MRRIYFLALSFLIFSLSVSFVSARTFAFTGDVSASSSSEVKNEVNYELPYPGLLPDSPIYFLRAIRDKIVGLLISDPLKKTEFNLLQSDKRLNAGIYLFNKGNISLSYSTISKAENYFEQALDKMGEAKKQGKSTDDIKGKLKESSKKHEQELRSLIQRANAEFKISFAKELERAVSFEERLSH